MKNIIKMLTIMIISTAIMIIIISVLSPLSAKYTVSLNDFFFSIVDTVDVLDGVARFWLWSKSNKLPPLFMYGGGDGGWGGVNLVVVLVLVDDV